MHVAGFLILLEPFVHTEVRLRLKQRNHSSAYGLEFSDLATSQQHLGLFALNQDSGSLRRYQFYLAHYNDGVVFS